MSDNTVTDVRDVARGAVEVIARRMLEIANPHVYPLEWSKDDAALLVSADGVHVRLVPCWDRIRHARVNVYVSDETTKPGFHYEWFRPCKTVFAESLCDDPLDEFDGMVEAIVKDLRRLFANSFDIEYEDVDRRRLGVLWANTPKHVSAYDDDWLRDRLHLPADCYDHPRVSSMPPILSFEDLSDHRRTEPIVYDVNEKARERYDRPADQPGSNGLVLGSYMRIRSDELSDEERDSGNVAFVSNCDSVKHIDGETYERIMLSAKISRATETQLDHDLVEYVETIAEAFSGAGFDVVRADYTTARVCVRHPEYGEVEVCQKHPISSMSYSEQFSVRCLDLMCETQIGVYIAGDDMHFKKGYQEARTARCALPEAERKSEFRAALMEYIRDEMPRIARECFEHNVVAKLGWSKTSEFFDDQAAVYCSSYSEFSDTDTPYNTVTTDASTTNVYKDTDTIRTWGGTLKGTKTRYFAVREINCPSADGHERSSNCE